MTKPCLFCNPRPERINGGPTAGQSVPHLHNHLIPQQADYWTARDADRQAQEQAQQ
jgi:diadenosine tetraphosphate (Ap4A) HIT family hydrolase